MQLALESRRYHEKTVTFKVRSLFKVGKQTAGCTEFCTETGLCSLVSVQKLEHPAVCLPSLKRERTLQGVQLPFCQK